MYSLQAVERESELKDSEQEHHQDRQYKGQLDGNNAILTLAMLGTHLATGALVARSARPASGHHRLQNRVEQGADAAAKSGSSNCDDDGNTSNDYAVLGGNATGLILSSLVQPVHNAENIRLPP